MKKQFFYAAFAMAMMASCTNDDVVVNPVEPTPEDSRVAIELGIDAPAVNAAVGSRSTGSVGDVAGDANKWNSQKLFITMVDKDKQVVQEDGKDLLGYQSYTYLAPTATTNTGVGGIRIYQTPPAEGSEEGTLKHLYYPVTGQYDFYGYHVDDITDATPNGDNPLLIEDITITGQQDIMGARTKEFTFENYQNYYTGGDENDFDENMIGWNFSARTARNGIKPILQFQHQLARLKFFVRAGSESAAEWTYDEDTQDWVKKETRTDVDIDGDENGEPYTGTEAMYVKSITVKNLANKLNMNLDNQGIITTEAVDPTTNIADFKLLSRDNNGTMQTTLTAVAPLFKHGSNITGETELEPYEDGTPVGESIMFFPTGVSQKTIDLDITLQQLVKDTEDETNDDVNTKYTWKLKEQTATLTIDARSVQNGALNATAGIFEPGMSYNVYITIYGFERIDVSAELTAWENGGNIDVDIEDKTSKYDVTYTITSDTPGAVIKINGETTETITLQNGESFTYSVEAAGYETTTKTEVAGNQNTTIAVTLNPTTPDPDAGE